MSNEFIVPGSGSVSTAGTIVTGTSSSTNVAFPFQMNQVPVHSAASALRAAQQLQDAVYGYIQAIRALGRTTVDLSEIASALRVSVVDVRSILPALEQKGVRIA